MDQRKSITDDVREELQMRYDSERFYYMARTPEARLLINADALHDVAADVGMKVRRLAEVLGLDEEVIARAQD